MNYKYAALTTLAILALTGVYTIWESTQWETLDVTATAYNSLPNQTSATHHDIAAWGDQLQPGMRAIAVSRDLITDGLGYRTRVRIHGLEGEWLVLDKMNKRWTRKIDIYMGADVKAARQWGRQSVTISWRAQEPD